MVLVAVALVGHFICLLEVAVITSTAAEVRLRLDRAVHVDIPGDEIEPATEQQCFDDASKIESRPVQFVPTHLSR